MSSINLYEKHVNPPPSKVTTVVYGLHANSKNTIAYHNTGKVTSACIQLNDSMPLQVFS